MHYDPSDKSLAFFRQCDGVLRIVISWIVISFFLLGHELFIMEWTFTAIAKTPLVSFKRFITHFKQLERKLQEISRIAVTEPTLCSYEMLCMQKNKLTTSEVNVWQALLHSFNFFHF